ncbi:MAG: hypothetical protein JWP61_1076 [Friedmanniella sp.]|nr:hypothetical protein [Friedmanniella sp.]
MTDLPERRAIHRAAVGIGLYAGAFGLTFGAVSVGSGLSLGQTLTLSLLMFTGASQFAFVGVVAAGGSPLAAVAPALLLGLRNAFYGVGLAPVLRPRGLRRLATAHLVIDETTAMSLAQPQPRARRYAFWATGLALFPLWLVGTLVGALLGQAVDLSAYGLDAAGPAVFLALLWPGLRTRLARLVAVGGAAVGFVLVPLVPAGVPVIAAALVAVVAGMLAPIVPHPPAQPAGAPS